jgi:hypothetical protein
MQGAIVIRYEMEAPEQADALWRALNPWLGDTTVVQIYDTSLYEGVVVPTNGTLIYVEPFYQGEKDA